MVIYLSGCNNVVDLVLLREIIFGYSLLRMIVYMKYLSECIYYGYVVKTRGCLLIVLWLYGSRCTVNNL